MWSLGVTWLELVMGTPHVFQVDHRTRVKLYHQLRMDAMPDVSKQICPYTCDSLLLKPCWAAALDLPGSLCDLSAPYERHVRYESKLLRFCL